MLRVGFVHAPRCVGLGGGGSICVTLVDVTVVVVVDAGDRGCRGAGHKRGADACTALLGDAVTLSQPDSTTSVHPTPNRTTSLHRAIR